MFWVYCCCSKVSFKKQDVITHSQQCYAPSRRRTRYLRHHEQLCPHFHPSETPECLSHRCWSATGQCAPSQQLGGERRVRVNQQIINLIDITRRQKCRLKQIKKGKKENSYTNLKIGNLLRIDVLGVLRTFALRMTRESSRNFCKRFPIFKISFMQVPTEKPPLRLRRDSYTMRYREL